MTASAVGSRARRDPGATAVVVAIALGVGGLVLAGWFPMVTVPDTGGTEIGLISRIYDPPSRSVEVAYNVGDGQVFATQAVDPFAGDEAVIRGGPEEVAYRYQRGAYGWVGWLASAGVDDAVPWSLAGVTVVSVAALVGVAAEVIRRRGGPPSAALVLLVTPGVITNLFFIGPESLGTAALVAGVMSSWRRPAGWPAVLAFAAAGVCRETFLLVPATLALVALARRDRRTAARLALAAVPYAAWVGLLRLRLGEWPLGSTDGRLTLVPFSGPVEVASRWGLDDVAAIALVAALAVAGLVRGRTTEMRALLAVHVVLAAASGPAVWSEAAHIGRVLLPLAALGLITVAAPMVVTPAGAEGRPSQPERAWRRAPSLTPG